MIMKSSNATMTKIADLKSGKLTCLQNVRHFLSNIERDNEKYNILLEINSKCERIAKKLDKKRENKEKLGILFGLCFVFKSNISIKDMHISSASRVLENYKGTFDADVVERVIREDGIIIGIANNDEFASGSSGENSSFGPSVNPVLPTHVPGGSSSGSACAVARDFCDIAFGTDTGGSIRNPASFCCVVGVKPSYGRVSRYGAIDLAMSFDQIGPLSKDVYSCALAMSVISGFSENDATTFDRPVKDYTKCVSSSKKFKIGVISEFEELISDRRIASFLDEKLERLEKMGHEIVKVSIKNVNLAIQAYYPIVYSEFFSGTRKLDGVKYGWDFSRKAGKEALRRAFGGAEISKSEFEGAYYKKALRVKEIIAKEFEKAFGKVDFIITPVTPRLPHKTGSKISVEDMYAYDAFTVPANLAGICAGVVSKDKIKDEGFEVPVGIQVFCDKFNEEVLFEGLSLVERL